MGRAIAGIAAARTSDDPAVRTFEDSTLRDAALHHSTLTISGYLRPEGSGVALTATVRDESGQKNLKTIRASGNLFGLAESLAVATGAKLRPYTTSNAAAVEALYRGVADPDTASAGSSIERAIALDPQFGAAHVSRIDLLMRTGRRDEARGLIETALGTRLTPFERARLEYLKADLGGDIPARNAALMRLAEFRPGDIEIGTLLATSQLAARDYRGAARSLEKLLEVSPAEENALNLRGYAYAFAGDEGAALRAMEEYRRRMPNSANAIDSQGEVNFFFGRFEEASKLFLEAHEKNPALVNGTEPLRAAFAVYLSGNLEAANRLIGTLRQNVPGAANFRPAVWRRLTGQPQAGMPQSPATLSVEALWLLADGNRDGAAQLAAKAQSQTQDPGSRGLANLVALLSQPSTSPEEWKQRLLRALPAPQAAAERERLLGWALMLDKQPAAAAEIWTGVAGRAAPPGGNEERLLLAWSLIRAGKPGEARQITPRGFMPPDSFDPSLTGLVWEHAREVFQGIR